MRSMEIMVMQGLTMIDRPEMITHSMADPFYIVKESSYVPLPESTGALLKHLHLQPPLAILIFPAKSFDNSVANLLSAIAAYCCFSKHLCINVSRMIDTQPALFWIRRTHVIYLPAGR